MGRNVDKTERMAIDIATARLGAKVLGIGNVDVRNYGNLQNAAETCFRELGGIDYLMCAVPHAGANLTIPYVVRRWLTVRLDAVLVQQAISLLQSHSFLRTHSRP